MEIGTEGTVKLLPVSVPGVPDTSVPGLSALGAGLINPPVLKRCVAGLIIPELPICKTLEFVILPIFIRLI
jgi:hypothetical protein